ncbi:MAG: hypothetical protein ACR2PF_20985 [Rhizobiaceae bacterium]
MDEGNGNIHILNADGAPRWDEYATFDAILVSGVVPEIPENPKSQPALAERIVVPVDCDDCEQELVRITRGKEGNSVARIWRMCDLYRSTARRGGVKMCRRRKNRFPKLLHRR